MTEVSYRGEMGSFLVCRSQERKFRRACAVAGTTVIEDKKLEPTIREVTIRSSSKFWKEFGKRGVLRDDGTEADFKKLVGIKEVNYKFPEEFLEPAGPLLESS